MSRISSQHMFWRLAAPMMLSNISVATLGLVDTAVIGHLGEAYYLAAIAIGVIVFDFIYWGLAFLRMGTTSLTAQAEGDQNQSEVVIILYRAILLAITLSLFLLLAKDIVINAGLSLLKGSDLAKEHATAYCQIVIWSMPAVLLTLSISGWLLGVHDAIATLKIALVVNLINIALDLILVVYFELGVEGVAYATVVANYLGLMFAITIVYKRLSSNSISVGKEDILLWRKLKELFVFNRDIFIRTLCLLCTFAFFIRQSGEIGDVTLAANSILIKFYIFTALTLDGYAQAAEVMVGNAIGSKKRQQFESAIVLAVKWSVGTSLAFFLCFLLFDRQIIALITNVPEVQVLAHDYVIWVVFLPLISVWSFVLDGIFIGAGRALEMRNNMLISTFIVFLPAWYLTQDLGNHGLWLAFIMFMVYRGAGLAYAFFHLDRQNKFVLKNT